jgi:3-hydroxyisobutyrate dehydrogenase
MSTPPVGFVGIGNMGVPMVRCLMNRGVALRLYDARPDALASFRGAAGIEIADSLPALGRGLDVVITMLPDAGVVEAVALGSAGHGGFARGMRRGGLIVDMSSSFPLATRALAGRVSGFGLGVVDAPVSGGVGKARSGTLAIMAGGAVGDLERVRPLLEAMGTVHPTGPLGSGHAMKALNNYVSAAGLIATAEALVIGAAFGLDPARMTQVLNASTGRNNTTENKVERYMLSARFDSGFSLALMAKDVAMADELASGLAIGADQLAAVNRYLRAACAGLPATADHTAVYAFAQGLAAAASTSQSGEGASPHQPVKG